MSPPLVPELLGDQVTPSIDCPRVEPSRISPNRGSPCASPEMPLYEPSSATKWKLSGETSAQLWSARELILPGRRRVTCIVQGKQIRLVATVPGPIGHEAGREVGVGPARTDERVGHHTVFQAFQ